MFLLFNLQSTVRREKLTQPSDRSSTCTLTLTGGKGLSYFHIRGAESRPRRNGDHERPWCSFLQILWMGRGDLSQREEFLGEQKRVTAMKGRCDEGFGAIHIFPGPFDWQQKGYCSSSELYTVFDTFLVVLSIL